MKTNINLIGMTAILFAIGASAGCQTKTESKITTMNQPAAQMANTATKPNITKTEVDKFVVADSLRLPAAAYKTAFALRESKDVSGLKKVLSKSMLEFLSEMGKSENKTLDDQLQELVAQPQAAAAEARNERIVGDLAALEYLDADGKWKLMGFAREEGEWKMTVPDAKITAILNAPR